MISRPLDLASKLRPEPRSFDWLFYVNAGLLVLFFSLFGSRFVLAPGVTLLPGIAGADAQARPATHYITVNDDRQIFAGDGLRKLDGLATWLRQQAADWRADRTRSAVQPVLLIQSSDRVDLDLVAQIISAASEQGFAVQVAAVEPPAKAGAAGKARAR